MQRSAAIVVVLVSAAAIRADEPTLQEARERLLRGNYAEARELYTALARDAKNKPAAVIGLSRAWDSEGQYDKSLSVIDAALKELPDSADLQARRAEILYQRGRWEDAEKAAAAALTKNDEHFLAHWILGQIYRDRGEIDKADEHFVWFVRLYRKRDEADMPITDPEQLVLVGLAGCERARLDPDLKKQFRFILNEVYSEAVKRDKDFWWAEYEAGRLLAEKYNKGGAYRAFERALTINPQAAEVYAAKGHAALQNLSIKDATLFADEALKINPNLPDALRLHADLETFAEKPDSAQKTLEKALAINPREEETLARVGLCLLAQKKHAEFQALEKKVFAFNSKPARFYYEMAEQLHHRKFFADAEKYYRLSIKLNPKLPWPQNGLGLLYMALGKEDEAKKVLEQAFEFDAFNVHVRNTLKVLDHLEKYDTLNTEHFLVRFDATNDKVLANYMAKYLEDIYAELADLFQYRPKGKILIEIFNKHEMFSGRVVALPDLHTIGACTGRMFAMVSPRDKSKVIAKPFNWNRVIRHEMVHIFNLDQTNFQIPHWFTEGLAVRNEGFPPPPDWHYLLARRVAANDLMNLDNIMMGFAVPGTEKNQLAYLQANLYVSYLVEKHGKAAIGRLLAAYADGLDTSAAIENVCKTSKADFEKGYLDFLKERVKSSGIKLPAKTVTFKKLKEEHAKNPDDADIAAQLAERFLRVGDRKQARQLAEAVLLVKQNHPIAAYVKARLLIEGGQGDEALSVLQAAVDPDNAEAKVLKLLGKLQADGKKFAEAAKTFEAGRKLEPFDPYWLTQLARAYKQTQDQDKFIEVLKALVPMNADDLAPRRELAKLLMKAGQADEAERYARQALEIDVLDATAQETLESALVAQNKEKELKQLREVLGK
jgi:tetratricopeptide (TPR) repeat protein